MRGIFRHNPPAARYKVTWDPKVVLNYLETFGNNQDLGLLDLTLDTRRWDNLWSRIGKNLHIRPYQDIQSKNLSTLH